MPGNWDGKSRPSNDKYRSNYDDIFKKKECPCGRSPDGVTIKESSVQGLGLFATKDFDADVVLGIVHVLNKNFPHGSIRTALGAFYNHSDNPNCRNVAGFWHQLPVKYLITTKPIKAGDELTAAYTLYKDFSDKWE